MEGLCHGFGDPRVSHSTTCAPGMVLGNAHGGLGSDVRPKSHAIGTFETIGT